MTKSARRLAVVIMLIMVTTAAGCSRSTDEPEARDTDGPLRVTNPHGWAVSVEPGRPFTDGLEVLLVDGQEPITIDAVTLLGSEEIELVAAYVVPPPRRLGAVQLILKDPPTARGFGDSRPEPAEGAVVGPAVGVDRGGWELLLTMRAPEPGEFRRTGVKIDYRSEGELYTATLPSELVICSDPGSTDVRDCRSSPS